MLTLITYPHGDHLKSPALPYPLQDLLHISLNFRITIPLFSASLFWFWLLSLPDLQELHRRGLSIRPPPLQTPWWWTSSRRLETTGGGAP